MSDVLRVLTELVGVTRALEHSLADLDREPDLDLLEARSALVNRLRELLERGGLDPAPADLARCAGELQEADRRLRRIATVRLHSLHRAITDLSQQRIALRGYLGGLDGGHRISYC